MSLYQGSTNYPSIIFKMLGAEILADMKQVSHRGPPVLERPVSLLSGAFCLVLVN